MIGKSIEEDIFGNSWINDLTEFLSVYTRYCIISVYVLCKDSFSFLFYEKIGKGEDVLGGTKNK